jgi:hypothetical protein
MRDYELEKSTGSIVSRVIASATGSHPANLPRSSIFLGDADRETGRCSGGGFITIMGLRLDEIE